ncbi:MAG TPA: AraC family ligand binding domain-containing protein [Candidatus Acidoferrum sp.]|nr:AraC family ligand binding domain-containing protein [Candidatus Acidoferrum sp.]
MPTCSTRAWTLPGIPGLACFRAANLVHEYSRHRHSTWAIGVVDDGTGGIWYRGEWITIRAGEVHTGHPPQRAGISYSMPYVDEKLERPGYRIGFFGSESFPVAIQAPHWHDRRCVCRRSRSFKTGTDAAERM